MGRESLSAHLFIELSEVHILLNGASRDKPVYPDISMLTYPVCPVLSLEVIGRIPVGVKDDHYVGTGQIQTNPSSPGVENDTFRSKVCYTKNVGTLLTAN